MNRMRKVNKYALIIGLIFSFTLNGQEEINHYRRAPDVLPGTLPEMRTPDFWITRFEHPDRAILSLPRIQQMNEDYQYRMQNPSSLEHGLADEIKKQLESWSGLVPVEPDLENLTRKELVKKVQEMIKSQIKYMRKKDFGNILGIEYADWEIDNFEENMDFDSIDDIKGIRHGVTVCNSRIRVVPTLRPEHVAVENNGRARWDMFNLDIVPIASPVEILHTSKSGAYMLVLTERGFGWINSENIAFADQNLIGKCRPEKDFIICAGETVPYYADSSCQYLSGWLRMGDRLGYSIVNNQFQITIPFRNTDASLSLEKVWLKKDADVHKGFMAYTQRNIIGQAFKLIDQAYDYTGAWFGRNHATILRDLFSCFGFTLPGNGVLLKAYNYSGGIKPEVGKETQYQTILSNEPCVTILITWSHSQLYIGEYNSIPYVFDTHGYGYTGDDGKEYIIRRSCIYNPELPKYMLKNEMTFVTLQ